MYMLDGQNDSTTTFIGKPGADILYKQSFYQSPKLGGGQHELVVTLTTSGMNTMWIDYFQVEKPATASPGIITGVLIGGIVGIMLLVIIGILLRRISRLKRRRVQYEKVPRKATHAYWPWMSRPPGELTPFGNDPFSDTQPFKGPLRPFSIQYIPYSPESSEPPDLSNGTSLSGYTVRGDTAKDKTTARESISTNTGHTSLSGYMTRGGTSADKTVASPTSIASPSASSPSSNTTGHTSYDPRYTVQGTTQTQKTKRSSRPSSGTNAVPGSHCKEQPSSTRTPSDLTITRSRPLIGPTITNRVVAEGEEVPPAYSTEPRHPVLDPLSVHT
ncbi:hypothetical protein C0995_015447 [Termitomyces sp. Mi166|nr:hypothetical protein C0995_015447 [Termitomyces sp. Mi166\